MIYSVAEQHTHRRIYIERERKKGATAGGESRLFFFFFFFFDILFYFSLTPEIYQILRGSFLYFIFIFFEIYRFTELYLWSWISSLPRSFFLLLFREKCSQRLGEVGNMERGKRYYNIEFHILCRWIDPHPYFTSVCRDSSSIDGIS